MRRSSLLAWATATMALAGMGCERDTGGLGIAPLDTDPVVFDDTFGDGVGFQAFLGTKVDAIALDTEQRRDGTTSLRVTVPGPGDDTGGFAGGAFTAGMQRDLSGYNALTFWAKADRAATLNVAGIANDNTGTSLFEASRSELPLTTTWTKQIVPIPLPARLDAERGLFFFAEGHENDQGYRVWLDDIRFENVAGVTNPRATLLPATRAVFIGQTIAMENTRTTFNVEGVDQTVFHMPGYFTFASSDEAVARIVDGQVRIVGVGSAFITAKLGEADAGGRVTLNAAAPPMDPAPVPTLPAADVIALFSNAYANHPVDTWSTSWDQADLTDLAIAGDDVKAYAGLGYAGIEFATSTVDASAMTHFHIDAWAPDGFFIKLKLVDFGGDGAFGGGDDSESAEIGFLLANNEWVGFDIPIESFTGLANRAHLAQLIVLGNPSLLFVDNLYFHK